MRAFFTIITITIVLFTIIVLATKPGLNIVDTPISFSKERVELTKEYAKQHYDLNLTTITIEPKMIVLHWSEESNLTRTYNLFNAETIPSDWGDVSKNGAVNVSAHFLVGRDGRIFRLMPETQMARHIIGLNYSAIGIENIGGDVVDGKASHNLTQAQFISNVRLVRYLKTAKV